MSENRHMITADGMKKLQEKLDNLLQVRRPEISQRISAARDLGDISENSEYDEAKREQAEIEEEIVMLQNEINNSVIIDESALPNDEVRIGSKIRVRDMQFKTEAVYDIIGSSEADPFSGKISNMSPLGSALMHCKKGATVKINTPDGFLQYKLIEILPKES